LTVALESEEFKKTEGPLIFQPDVEALPVDPVQT